MADKHTPLPWEIVRTDTGIETTGCGPVKARFNMDEPGAMREEAEANARLIVRAVNNFDALVEAAEGVLQYNKEHEPAMYYALHDLAVVLEKIEASK